MKCQNLLKERSQGGWRTYGWLLQSEQYKYITRSTPWIGLNNNDDICLSLFEYLSFIVGVPTWRGRGSCWRGRTRCQTRRPASPCRPSPVRRVNQHRLGSPTTRFSAFACFSSHQFHWFRPWIWFRVRGDIQFVGGLVAVCYPRKVKNVFLSR